MDKTSTTLNPKTTRIVITAPLLSLTCEITIGVGLKTLASGKHGSVVESTNEIRRKVAGASWRAPIASPSRKLEVSTRQYTTIHKLGAGTQVYINLVSSESKPPPASAVYTSKNVSKTDKEAKCLQAQCVSPNASTEKISDQLQRTIVLYFVAIWLPFLPVAMLRGCSADLLINILLDILGWIPGVIHAWYIISKSERPERRPVRYKDTRY
jgi:uncharacterized membrane protein YqaE (UPF0057 family)